MKPGSRPSLLNVIYIRATEKDLWNALTRPEFTRQYYGGLDVEAELKAGGKFDYSFRWEAHERHGTAIEGRITRIAPDRKLVHAFHPKFITDGRSRVAYEIEPMGLVCKLTVTHDRFLDAGPTLEIMRDGWPMILSSLKSLLETGEALPLRRLPNQAETSPPL